MEAVSSPSLSPSLVGHHHHHQQQHHQQQQHVVREPASPRDPRWLTLEVCREFQRGACTRPHADCRFAHPPAACHVEGGRVTACFDSLKGRCARENCKYLHPPPHLKTQLEINGRNNLIQQKLLTQQMHSLAGPAVLPGQPMQSLIFPFGASLGLGPGASGGPHGFGPYLGPVSPGLGLLPHDLLPPPGGAAVVLPGGGGGGHAGHLQGLHAAPRTDRLEVCREFLRGNCCRGESECRFAHPAGEGGAAAPADPSSSAASCGTAASCGAGGGGGAVTVCMDHVRGRCCRERCRYFHPPPHLQARLKAAQQQQHFLFAAGHHHHHQQQQQQLLHHHHQQQQHQQQQAAAAVTAMALAGYAVVPQQAAFLHPGASIFCMTPGSGNIVPMMHAGTPATISTTTASPSTVPFMATANQIIQ